jgi:hypothetical protein
MPIFDREPEDWVHLQNLVGQMFTEVGCDVETGRSLQLVRGNKEVDVWVRDPDTTPPSEYLCECKFWSKAIPQEVIHAFRTVVSDYGAHRGFIVSRVGFQSGAYDAVRKTNVNIVTFAELQEMFFDRWRIAMGERFTPYADRLFPYWDYPGKMPRIKWGEEHVERRHLLIEAYRPLLKLGPLARMERFIVQLPIVLPSLDSGGQINGQVVINSYRQLYDFIDSKKDEALKQFQILYGEMD